MIIRGNTVGTPMPRSDYAQEDPKAADYIKNKPDAAIQRAQECADQALAAVDAARAEAKAYTDAAQAEAGAYTDTAKAEAKSYTDTAKAEAKSYTDSKRIVLTAVIAAENWVSDSTLYVNQVTVAELKSSDMPHIVPSYNWESGTPYTQKEAWDKVSYATSLDGAINFVALEDLPTTDIPIQIEVNR